jgi:hypothetical protein
MIPLTISHHSSPRHALALLQQATSLASSSGETWQVQKAPKKETIGTVKAKIVL